MSTISTQSNWPNLAQIYETTKATIEREVQSARLQIHLNEWLNNPLASGDKRTAARLILDCFQREYTRLTLSSLHLTLLPEKALALLPNLQDLDCSNNQLSSLDLSNLPNLHWLNCSYNQLSSLDFSNLPNLQHLDYSYNQLESLNLSNFPNLDWFHCSHNQLESLDLSNLPNLDWLHCSHNQLSSLDFSNLPNLQHLDYSYNQLESLNFSNLPNLQHLDCSYNQLESLILDLPNLQHLDCSHNQLESLILDLPNLQWFHCSHNPQLQELPLSLCTCNLLTYIECNNNLLFQADLILNTIRTNRAKEAPLRLPAELSLWVSYAKVKNQIAQTLLSSWTDEQKGHIREWLLRLTKTPDFSGRQEALAKVVCAMLQDTTQNKDFSEFFFTQVPLNNESCEDRAAMAFNELYVAWRILCAIPTDKNQQLQLLVQAGKTFTLRAAIAEEMQKQPDSSLGESVEIFLYYESTLQSQLGLLTFIEHTRYAQTIGKRDWIREDDLINTVQSTYADFSIGIPIFDKLLEKNGPSAMARIAALTREAQENLNPTSGQTEAEHLEAVNAVKKELTQKLNEVKKEWFLEQIK